MPTDQLMHARQRMERRASYQSVINNESTNDVTGEVAEFAGARKQLRRGHSDGEVIGSSVGSPDDPSDDDEPSQERSEGWKSLLKTRLVNTDRTYGRVLDEINAIHTEQAERRKRARLGIIHGRRLSPSASSEAQGSSAQIPQRPKRSVIDSRAGVSGSSMTNVIDLTSPERPLPVRLSPRASSHTSNYGDRRSKEIILPRWQSDLEVSRCPICGNNFGFWFRKHHCRKCGRVVCANCSPHRITIPRQFIVRPPISRPTSESITLGAPVIDLTDESEALNIGSIQGESRVVDGSINPALGGGEEVRICNPCVPDPNFNPPPQRAPEPISRASFRASRSEESSSSLNDAHSPTSTLSRALGRARRHSHFNRHAYDPSSSEYVSDQSPVQPLRDSRRYSALPAQPRHTSDSPSTRNDSHSERPIPSPRFNVYTPLDRRHAVSLGYPQDHRRHTSTPSAATSTMPPRRAPHNPFNPFNPFNQGSSYGAPGQGSNTNRPSQPRPDQNTPTSSGRQVIRSMLDIDTPPPAPRPPQPTLREEDICPVCHLILPPKGPDGSETAREQHVIDCISNISSKSAPPTGTAAAAVASSAAQPTVGGHVRQGSRGNMMLQYLATEKDCVGDEGGAQECVICFEEFVPGSEMARLECLCKFHKICIKQWWDTKGKGSCPVHLEMKG